jgi:hypothetical protein
MRSQHRRLGHFFSCYTLVPPSFLLWRRVLACVAFDVVANESCAVSICRCCLLAAWHPHASGLHARCHVCMPSNPALTPVS